MKLKLVVLFDVEKIKKCIFFKCDPSKFIFRKKFFIHVVKLWKFHKMALSDFENILLMRNQQKTDDEFTKICAKLKNSKNV